MIINNDSLTALKELPEDHIDCLITDPPYGISFFGKQWDKALPSIEVWEECLRVMKPGAFGFIMCTPRQDCLSRMILNLDMAGFQTNFTSIYWTYATGFPKAQNLSKAADRRAGAEREVVGTKMGLPGYPITKNKGREGYSGGWQDPVRECEITASVTEEAKQLEGAYAGMQLKPAVEIIIVVMKPLDQKTYLDQALTNGKGCTHLDDCRIPNGVAYGSEQGRFPANLLVSDDCLGSIQTKSAGRARKGGTSEQDNPNSLFWKQSGSPNGGMRYGDSGSYSRFFDLDVWWGPTLEGLPQHIQDTFPFLYCPKASRKERNKGLEGLPETNSHPTVKPIKLMAYLITLGSRPGDIVLDPYLGSGTTTIAARMLDRDCLGIERDSEYVAIAQSRLASLPA